MSEVTRLHVKRPTFGNGLSYLTLVGKSIFFVIVQKALETFDYDVTEESDVLVAGKWREDDSQMRAYRTVMLVPWKDMEKITTEMEQFVV